MNKVKLLPENLINQIAAGEVVERPASVVKELVENSLDANARNIVIEIDGGGDELIRITDDGEGMSKEDALSSFERYATSKISSSFDLDNISTFGFRGEALATIASVSFVTLQTKTKDSIEGTLIVNEGGKIVKNKQIGAPMGTQIEVKQLFYNTPARKKYLKNDSTEYGHILSTVTGMAISNPSVSFKLIHNKKIVFDLPITEDSLVRIRGLLGRSVSTEMIPVFYGHSKINLKGFIGKPNISRSSRNGQYLFVNGRLVNSHVLSYAVKQSFYSLVPKEKHPVFVLFLDLDPAYVDVNVHPRKLEVRFSDEKEVFSVFLKACKFSLEKYVLSPSFSTNEDSRVHSNIKDNKSDHYKINSKDNLTSNLEHQQSSLNLNFSKNNEYENYDLDYKNIKNKNSDVYSNKNNFSPSSDNSISYLKDSAGSSDNSISYLKDSVNSAENFNNNDNSNLYVQDTKSDLQTATKTEVKPIIRGEEDDLTPLAQLNKSYILCEQGGSLVIIDQHAGHERVRYEEILSDFEQKNIISQPLLTPEQLELSYFESQSLNENMQIFKDLGFEIEPFGDKTFSVFAVPSYLTNENILETIIGILDDISKNSVKGDLQSRKERALTYSACRSAVKFGDTLSMEEMRSLCNKLLKTKQPYTCPHGRPTIVKVTPDSLEKMFGRK